MKVIGGLLVFLGSGLGGILIANALHERTRELQQFIRALNLLLTEIGFGRNPLEVAFRRIAESLSNSVGAFFTKVADRMSQNGSAGTAWREAIEASRSLMSCSSEDWAALEEFATSLGLMDKDSQIKSIQSVILRIEASLRDAQEKIGANDRILRYAGFALGLVLVLIFI